MSVASVTLWSWSHSDLLCCQKDSVGTVCASSQLFNRNVLKTAEPKMHNFIRYFVKQDVMIHNPVLSTSHMRFYPQIIRSWFYNCCSARDSNWRRKKAKHAVTSATVKSLRNGNCCWLTEITTGTHGDTCGMVQQHTTCKWLFIVFFFSWCQYKFPLQCGF